MDVTLDGDTVVQTTTVNLTEFVMQKRQELEMLSHNIQQLTYKQNEILSQLENLLPKEN